MHLSKEIRRKLSKAHKGLVPWNKGKKGLQVGWSKGMHLSKETIRKISEAKKGQPSPMKGKHQSEEARRKMSKSQKKRFEKTSTWNKGMHLSEEEKKKISEVTKKAMSRPEVRKKVSKTFFKKGQTPWNKGKGGELAINWQGGLSFEPYDPAFNNLFKKLIRAKFKHKCFICGKPASSVHHINYTKKETIEKNVVLLCMNCHAKTNSNRDYWFAFLCYHLGIEPDELAE